MKNFILAILCFSAMIFSEKGLLAQDKSPTADTFFSAGLHKMTREILFVSSLPTLEECEMIFKPESAQRYFAGTRTYHKKIIDYLVMRGLAEVDATQDVKFEVDTFTMKDILAKKRNYAGGMQMIMEHYLPDLEMTFYSVAYMDEETDIYGTRYNNFVYLNERWVFMPKPWRILE